MASLKTWVQAARLRTLPLSVSGILMGTAIAAYYGYSDSFTTILAILTTIGFQVTSNFANDYGDGVKGTDNEERVGPTRAIQSGALSPKGLKKGIIISIVINLVLVLLLLGHAFSESPLWILLLFLGLGIASIWAAVSYTVGTSAYGYRGLGDLFVFLFFGLLSVLGSFFLYTKFINGLIMLPAICIGLLSTAVLNLNNMRDIVGDTKAGKYTLAVKLGAEKAKRYHVSLIIFAFISMLAFLVLTNPEWPAWVGMLAFIPLVFHLRYTTTVSDPAAYDSELKKVALSTFALALLTYLAYNYFL